TCTTIVRSSEPGKDPIAGVGRVGSCRSKTASATGSPPRTSGDGNVGPRSAVGAGGPGSAGAPVVAGSGGRVDVGSVGSVRSIGALPADRVDRGAGTERDAAAEHALRRTTPSRAATTDRGPVVTAPTLP